MNKKLKYLYTLILSLFVSTFFYLYKILSERISDLIRLSEFNLHGLNILFKTISLDYQEILLWAIFFFLISILLIFAYNFFNQQKLIKSIILILIVFSLIFYVYLIIQSMQFGGGCNMAIQSGLLRTNLLTEKCELKSYGPDSCSVMTNWYHKVGCDKSLIYEAVLNANKLDEITTKCQKLCDEEQYIHFCKGIDIKGYYLTEQNYLPCNLFLECNNTICNQEDMEIQKSLLTKNKDDFCMNLNEQQCFLNVSCEIVLGPTSCNGDSCSRDEIFKGCLSINNSKKLEENKGILDFVIEQRNQFKEICDDSGGIWEENRKNVGCQCPLSNYTTGKYSFDQKVGCINEKEFCESENGTWIYKTLVLSKNTPKEELERYQKVWCINTCLIHDNEFGKIDERNKPICLK